MKLSSPSAPPLEKAVAELRPKRKKTAGSEFLKALKSRSMTVLCFAGRYQNSRRVEDLTMALPIDGEAAFELAGGAFEAQVAVREGTVEGSYFFKAAFRVTAEPDEPISVGVQLVMDRWSPQNYVLMPGAVYAGNRFQVADSPAVEDCNGLAPEMPVTITNVPRLDIGDGESCIQLRTGDFSTPAVGVRDSRTRQGFFFLTNQGNEFGDHGVRLRESEDRTAASLTLQSPGIREGMRYSGHESFDRGVLLRAGEIITLEFGIYFFAAPCIQSLFDQFFAIRNDFRGVSNWRHEIPFSSCREIQHAKYNAQNWVEEHGYYSVGMRESSHQDWQTGWVGGSNALYPLFCDGDEETRARALRMLDFIWYGGVGDSGYFRSLFHKGEWLDRHLTLTRYQADSLYFIVRTYFLHRKRKPGEALPRHWSQLVRGCADALCQTWARHGQLGQRVNTDTGEIVMGETACAGLAPGALALCSDFLDDPRYLAVAEAAAERYHREFIQRGFTNGGPGDILQCPDSESAFALLETFVTLHEITGHERYLLWAREAAHQCATWVVNYDFQFPPDSTFGKLGMLTLGTVLANVQNKHSAPGICTLSGNSLFKLFRATGDIRYLDLIREIAHAIPQYMSRADRPICDRRPNQMWPVMDPGWVNERVNMSDWEVRGDPDNEIGVGEIFGGSTWSEVALMLTHSELPGIYLQPDTGLLAVLDHVDASLERDANGRCILAVTNPTKFHASVKLFAEDSGVMVKPLGPLAMHDCERIEVAPGATAFRQI